MSVAAPTDPPPVMLAEPSGTPRARDRGPRAWSRWFLVLGVPFGLFFVFATPPLQEIDSVAHYLRVRQVSQGHLVAPIDASDRARTEVDGCSMGLFADLFRRGGTSSPLRLGDNFRRPACVGPQRFDVSNTALNSPVAYAPQAVGFRLGWWVGGAPGAVYGARLFGLAAYLALCWWALRLAPRGQALLFATALLPSSLALASYLSADGPCIALALLAMAVLLRLRSADAGPAATRRRDLATLAVSLLLLGLSKNLYAVFVLLVLLVPAGALGSTRARWAYRLGTLGAVAAAAALWSSQVVARIHFHHTTVVGADSWRQRDWVQHHPGGFLLAVWHGLGDPWVRRFSLPGFVEVVAVFRPKFAPVATGDRAPLWLFAVAVALLAVALAADVGGRPAAGDRPPRGALAATLAVSGVVVVVATLLMFLGEYLTTTPVGADTIRWVQGRYFLPLVPLLLLPASVVTRPRTEGRSATAVWLVPATSLFLLLWVAWRALVVFY